MKATVRVGDVVIHLSKADLSLKDVRGLTRLAGSIAVALAEAATPDPPEPAAPLGFTAHLERLPDDLASPPDD